MVCAVVVVVVGEVLFRERSLMVMEGEILGVGLGLVGCGIFDLGGDFRTVVVEVELGDLELGVKAILRLVWGCFRGRIYFLW